MVNNQLHQLHHLNLNNLHSNQFNLKQLQEKSNP